MNNNTDYDRSRPLVFVTGVRDVLRSVSGVHPKLPVPMAAPSPKLLAHALRLMNWIPLECDSLNYRNFGDKAPAAQRPASPTDASCLADVKGQITADVSRNRISAMAMESVCISPARWSFISLFSASIMESRRFRMLNLAQMQSILSRRLHVSRRHYDSHGYENRTSAFPPDRSVLMVPRLAILPRKI